jgi:hypothetical protein
VQAQQVSDRLDWSMWIHDHTYGSSFPSALWRSVSLDSRSQAHKGPLLLHNHCTNRGDLEVQNRSSCVVAASARSQQHPDHGTEDQLRRHFGSCPTPPPEQAMPLFPFPSFAISNVLITSHQSHLQSGYNAPHLQSGYKRTPITL